MPRKFLIVHSSGVASAELEALVQSRGAVDAGEIFSPGADGRWDLSLMPTGVGPDTLIAPASENLAAGDWLNAWMDGTTQKLRKADASAGLGKAATHFTLSTTPAGQIATAYPVGSGTNTAMTSLSPTVRYFLSNTVPGGVQSTPVTTKDHLNQFLGVARSATALESRQGTLVLRA